MTPFLFVYCFSRQVLTWHDRILSINITAQFLKTLLGNSSSYSVFGCLNNNAITPANDKINLLINEYHLMCCISGANLWEIYLIMHSYDCLYFCVWKLQLVSLWYFFSTLGNKFFFFLLWCFAIHIVVKEDLLTNKRFYAPSLCIWFVASDHAGGGGKDILFPNYPV